MTSNSSPFAAPALPEPSLAANRIPVMAASKPESVKIKIRTRLTLIPQSCAAVAFPPVAKTERPNAVLRLIKTKMTNRISIMSADTGMPKSCPPSHSSTSFSSIGTGSALVINSPIPRKALHKPNVATKLGTLNTPRNTPASVPSAAPRINTIRQARLSGT
ncbi:MAG: hypothetical protein ACFWT4_25305 [Citrobacter braakii]